MKQYCRYCANALDYNGEAEDFLCNAKAPCGNNGAGKFYPAACGKGRHVYGVENSSYGNTDGQWVSCPNCGADMRGEK